MEQGILVVDDDKSINVTLSMREPGESLDPEKLVAVFGRRNGGNKSRRRETAGAGLGVTIVKAIVEAHGGRVEGQSSRKNQGDVFTTWIPHPA